VSSSTTARFPALRLPRRKTSVISPTTDQPLASVEPSDESLVSRICSGDREALAILFRRHARLVHATARRILRDKAEAEDLVQEVFLYIYRKAGLYDRARGSVRTWIFQTTYYQALLRRMKLTSQNYYDCADVAETKATEVSDSNPPPYDRSGQGLFGRGVWRELISCLTKDQWETLRLHFYEGYTFAEIAEKRKQSFGNVRNHFYRGLDRLRRRLCHE
jgi:RNA polymerase sigma-70 factor, ECF subfamily